MLSQIGSRATEITWTLHGMVGWSIDSRSIWNSWGENICMQDLVQNTKRSIFMDKCVYLSQLTLPQS